MWVVFVLLLFHAHLAFGTEEVSTRSHDFYWPILHVGSSGKMVKMANDIINVVLDIQPQPHKYSEEVASRFGEDVEVFIKELQSSSSIEPTGVIDSRTWPLLLKKAITHNLFHLTRLALSYLSPDEQAERTVRHVCRIFHEDTEYGTLYYYQTRHTSNCEEQTLHLASPIPQPAPISKTKKLGVRSKALLQPMKVIVDKITQEKGPAVIQEVLSATEQIRSGNSSDSEYLVAVLEHYSFSDLITFKPKPVEYHRNIYDLAIAVQTSDNSIEEHTATVAITPSNEKYMTGHIWKSLHKRSNAVDDEIIVMSYNIWNYNSDWEQRKQIIAAIIRKENPDIIGFQEIRYKWDDPDSNQAKQLSELLPDYQWIYQPAMHFTDQEEGLAVFVHKNITILEHSHVKLPLLDECSDKNQRIALLFKLQLQNEKIINFVDTHWSYVRECQMTNAYHTWEFVKDWTEPTFIVGDLNTYEDYQFPIDFMCGKVTYLDTTGDFKDMWTELHRHEEGFTFSSWKPETRADRMLQRKGEVLDIKTVGNQPVNGFYPSDHLGIVARI